MSYTTVSTDPSIRALQRQNLIDAHRVIGGRRVAVEEVMEQHASEFAFTIGFGRGSASVNMDGTVYDVRSADDQGDAAEDDVDVPSSISPLLTSNLSGAAFGNKTIGDVIMPCGVCLIVGAGGTGKTPLAHELAGYGVKEYAAVKRGEPLAGYNWTDDETAMHLAQAMVNHSDVVVDSIKDLLGMGGNLMRSGISRSVLIAMSNWSALANELGCTLYVPLNPSSDDPDVFNMVIESAVSNATSVISHESGQTWNYQCRTGEGLPRTTDVRLDFSSEGLAVGTGGASGLVASKSLEEGGFKSTRMVVPNGALARAIINASVKSEDN